MPSNGELNKEERLQLIEDVFQETMAKLKSLHEEQLELIKKFRADNNLIELNKIRETLKEKL